MKRLSGLNPLQSGVTFLYPLKTENLKGIEKQHWTVMG